MVCPLTMATRSQSHCYCLLCLQYHDPPLCSEEDPFLSNSAFSTWSCGFVFMNTVPLTFLSSSYHHLKKKKSSTTLGSKASPAGLGLQYLRSSVVIVIFRRPVPLGKGEAEVGTSGGSHAG